MAGIGYRTRRRTARRSRAGGQGEKERTQPAPDELAELVQQNEQSRSIAELRTLLDPTGDRDVRSGTSSTTLVLRVDGNTVRNSQYQENLKFFRTREMTQAGLDSLKCIQTALRNQPALAAGDVQLPIGSDGTFAMDDGGSTGEEYLQANLDVIHELQQLLKKRMESFQ